MVHGCFDSFVHFPFTLCVELLLIVVAPALCLALFSTSFNFLLTAVICNFLGLIVERWLFFAEAKHIVNLYYGREA